MSPQGMPRGVVTHSEYSWNVSMYVNRTNCLGFIVSNMLLLEKVEKLFCEKGDEDVKMGVTSP